ncbi:helix-turn-helix transcriptional regulator [Paenarthrobacter sp. PH39-S1]|uniref:helix-turn-helix domain-containing protein n=1 Tax=Paenarthrobacter sp. PH39-S1 TaxID=3046204 RepID=UPI0024BB5E28|nr:helix-turn-helix transcriptional regulator [Paenarthrobacter sp. PH39-S1]MDJ0355596.1 helix-turn-helix transcriptional regulator [Paenarthrobacter sp. PH39-S1]
MGVFNTKDAVYAAAYAEEAAMVDASEIIASALELSGMTKSELARALGVSKSEVTARLAGQRNITVRSLAKTLHILGARLELRSAHVERRGESERGRVLHMEQYRSRRFQREHELKLSSSIKFTERRLKSAMGSAK